MEEVNGCPLFTGRHAQHSAVWCVDGYSFPKLCIACAIERLENHSNGELSIHVKKILGEFHALLSSASAHACNSSFFSVLSTDSRLVEHLCGLLFDLLRSEQESIAQSSLDVLMTLLGLVKTQHISQALLQKAVHSVVTEPSLSQSLPHLTLLGQLLHSHSSLTLHLIHSHGGLLDFLVSGFSYPDERIKASVVYLFVQVASKAPPTSLPLSLVQKLAKHVSTNLATAKSHDLTINLLGLVRHLLKCGPHVQCLLHTDNLDSESKGSTFASAFKRVLLSSDELLQLAGVQCIGEVLLSHSDYTKVLLNADIAEFLFEALSSKNELLLNSLFHCLNIMAGSEEFYSSYHVVYGIEPILTGLWTLHRLRNHASSQSGIDLLTKILTRQSRGVALFRNPAHLHELLDLLSALLEVEVLTTPTATTLTALMSSQHVPRGFPLRPLLTPLAHLLSRIQPLTPVTSANTDTTVELTPAARNLISSTCQCFAGVCILALEEGGVCVSEDDKEFLLWALEESILPVFLFYLSEVEGPVVSVSVFSVINSVLQLVGSDQAVALAQTLCGAGFIQLIMEQKAKFPGRVGGDDDLGSVGNQLLVRLCVSVESVPDRLASVRDTLHQALPSLSGSPMECLQVLTQRSLIPGRSTSSTLLSAQSALLCLLYTAHTHDNQLVSGGDLMRALDIFLSLNPDLHQLPPTTLTHLTFLYAITSHETSCVEENARKASGVATLLRGVERVPDPAQLFVPDPRLIAWSLRECGGETSISKTWMRCWVGVASHCQSAATSLLLLLETSPQALKCITGLLVGSSYTEGGVCVSTVCKVLQQLLTDAQVGSSLCVELHKCLSTVILEQRVHPLPDCTVGTLLQLLTLTLHATTSVNMDIKLVYHIGNLVSRVSPVSRHDLLSPDASAVARWGLEALVLCVQCHPGDDDASTPIATVLANNQTLLQQLPTFLPQSSRAEDHSVLSAVAMEMISLLMSVPGSQVQMRGQSTPLRGPTLMSALLSPLPRVQIAGLNLWSSVFSSSGETRLFVVEGRGQSLVRQIKTLSFLLFNCLSGGSETVMEAADRCLVELIKYSSSLHQKWKKAISSVWSEVYVRYVADMWSSSSTAPPHFLDCCKHILQLLQLDERFRDRMHSRLRPLAQRLYSSLLPPGEGSPSQAQGGIASCLLEMEKVDRSCLEESQWSTLHALTLTC